ncbi:hypothetical protein ACS0TY_007471 [Phlomoides rotata]
MPLNYEFDGTTDPYDHLTRFENYALLHRYGEGVKYKFASARRQPRTTLTLFNMKQGESESLRAFLKRFNQAGLEVPTTSPEVNINALTNDHRDGDMFSSLAKKHVHTFDELLKRAEKYLTLEEVRKAKKTEANSSAHNKKKEPKVKSTRHDPPKTGRIRPRRRYEKYTPLKLEPAEVLEIAVGHPEMKFLWS